MEFTKHILPASIISLLSIVTTEALDSLGAQLGEYPLLELDWYIKRRISSHCFLQFLMRSRRFWF